MRIKHLNQNEDVVIDLQQDNLNDRFHHANDKIFSFAYLIAITRSERYCIYNCLLQSKI